MIKSEQVIRYFLLFICIVFVLGACPLIDADLDSPVPGTDGLVFVYETGIDGYRVSAGTITSGEVIIPLVHNDGIHGVKAVKKIAESAFEDLPDITKITIPTSILSIGDNAFRNCSGLTQLTIPFSVTEVGRNVITGCTSIYELSAPLKYPYDMNNNSYLKYYFGSAHVYDAVTVPENIKVFHILEGTTEITTEMFLLAQYLTTITIPSSVTSDGDSILFHACLELEQVIVDEDNNDLRSIDGVVFNKEATTLIQYPRGKRETEYTIPDGVTHIASRAFLGNGLKSIIIPEGVVSIDEKGFENSRNITSIAIPNSVETIGKETFSYCYNLTTITFGDDSSLNAIAEKLFEYSDSLVHVTIPYGVESIGNQAFYYCTGLETVVIPSSVTDIGWNAFSYCNQLIGINPVGVENSLLEGTERIGGSAFSFCTSLESIIFPSTLVEIGKEAFIGCSSLIRVDVDRRSSDGITEGGEDMFTACHEDLVIYVTDSASETAYKGALYWSVYASRIQKF